MLGHSNTSQTLLLIYYAYVCSRKLCQCKVTQMIKITCHKNKPPRSTIKSIHSKAARHILHHITIRNPSDNHVVLAQYQV